MARVVHNQLTALKVARLREPGTYTDGHGLQLVVREGGTKYWKFRYVAHGRAREYGLGSAHDMSLADAREEAAKLRAVRKGGVDPIDARKASRAARKAENGVTLKVAAERYIEKNKDGWRNAKHADQWTSTLATYAFPKIGGLPVGEITTEHVLACLQPIWTTKSETASRVRGRIETVLAFAAAQGWRSGDNPARWLGHLAAILPAKAKVARVEHHAAMPYADVPAFVARLRGAEGIGARALEFTILTAARTGEVVGATWPEIDLKAGTWTIPGTRMKSGREHRVPLCDRALAILKEMQALSNDGFVFPGAKAGKGLSNMSMDAVLRRMGENCTVHGFRSSFRDWAAERTDAPREVAEACLAHVLRDRTEAAYRRTDFFDKRRALLSTWDAHCRGGVSVDDALECPV